MKTVVIYHEAVSKLVTTTGLEPTTHNDKNIQSNAP